MTSPFRRVLGDRAGPGAVGILVPPGRTSVVIVRPRGLAWDLLLLTPDRTGFRSVTREEGAEVGEALYRALYVHARRGPAEVGVLTASDAAGYRVRLAVGAFTLLLCPRAPGEAYRPMTFEQADEAQAAARAVGEALCPPAGEEREIYVNTRWFQR